MGGPTGTHEPDLLTPHNFQWCGVPEKSLELEPATSYSSSPIDTLDIATPPHQHLTWVELLRCGICLTRTKSFTLLVARFKVSTYQLDKVVNMARLLLTLLVAFLPLVHAEIKIGGVGGKERYV